MFVKSVRQNRKVVFLLVKKQCLYTVALLSHSVPQSACTEFSQRFLPPDNLSLQSSFIKKIKIFK